MRFVGDHFTFVLLFLSLISVISVHSVQLEGSRGCESQVSFPTTTRPNSNAESNSKTEKQRQAAFLLACRAADIDTVQEYFQNVSAECHDECVNHAITRNHSDVVTALLAEGWRDNSDYLQQAASRGCLTIVRALLMHQNYPVSTLRHAVMISVLHNHRDVFDFMLRETKLQEDVDLRESMFVNAAASGHKETLEWLIDVDGYQPSRQTVLHAIERAVRHQMLEPLSFLWLEWHPLVSAAYWKTLMKIALHGGDVDIVRCLMRFKSPQDIDMELRQLAERSWKRKQLIPLLGGRLTLLQRILPF